MTVLAIHTKTGSFAEGWVEYCLENGVPFREVDCFSSDILEQLRGCRGLLWHWEHYDYRASLFARQLITSVEAMGLAVFPDTPTCWHYDDKVGQKYLLEAVGAPLVPSHVFYDRRSALTWLDHADFPVVWKLRSGAGGQNVRLVRDRTEAGRIVDRCFGAGWKPARFHSLQERVRAFRGSPSARSFVDIGRGLARAAVPHEKNRNATVERHYAYFQALIRDNDSDIRVIVIGDRAFAIKRMTRDGDFRASGSGKLVHDPSAIPPRCLELAFEVTRQLGAQSVAYDFMFDDGVPVIGEISYAFALEGYRACPGWWGPDLTWHEETFRPEYFMVEDILARVGYGAVRHA